MGVRGSSSFFLSSVTSVLKIIFKPIFDLIYDVIKQNKTWEGGKKKEKRKVKSSSLPGQEIGNFTKSKAVLAVGFYPSLPTVR